VDEGRLPSLADRSIDPLSKFAPRVVDIAGHVDYVSRIVLCLLIRMQESTRNVTAHFADHMLSFLLNENLIGFTAR